MNMYMTSKVSLNQLFFQSATVLVSVSIAAVVMLCYGHLTTASPVDYSH